MKFETFVKFGVPVLAIILVLTCSPRFKPRHVGPGETRWLGVTWVGPQERTVVSKHLSPERDEVEGPQDHVLDMGPRYSPVHFNATYEVNLQGYGWVFVDHTCYDRIKIGDTWNNNWKFGCK